MVKGTLARAIETRPRVQRAHIAFVASCQKSAMAPPKRDGDVHDKPKLLVEELTSTQQDATMPRLGLALVAMQGTSQVDPQLSLINQPLALPRKNGTYDGAWRVLWPASSGVESLGRPQRALLGPDYRNRSAREFPRRYSGCCLVPTVPGLSGSAKIDGLTCNIGNSLHSPRRLATNI
ncbi:hypothetical protein VTH82DRAFT_7808 [Thermothelomyces myriococcoides]